MNRRQVAVALAGWVAVVVAFSWKAFVPERQTWQQEACATYVVNLRAGLTTPVASARAEQAVASNNLSYLLNRNPYAVVPGIRDHACVMNAKIYEEFKAYSDAMCSLEYGAATVEVYEYAKSFNQRMLAARKARGLLTCDDA